PAREDAVGVHGVPEVVYFVGGSTRRCGGEDCAVARRRGALVDDGEEVGILLVGVAGPDVQHGLVLVGPEASDEDRFVLWAAARDEQPGGQGGEQEQRGSAIHGRVLRRDGSAWLNGEATPGSLPGKPRAVARLPEGRSHETVA